MTATKTSCGRCSRTLEDTTVGVSVDGGPMQSTDPVFRICPVSADRWPAGSSGDGTGPRLRGRSRRDPRRKRAASAQETSIPRCSRARRNRKALLRNIGLLTLLIMVNAFFVMMVISSWTPPSESG